VTDWNPPNRIQIPGVLALPVGAAVSAGSAIGGRRSAPRGLAAAGLALTAADLIGFIVLLVVLG
jgi:hypothetical protein